MARDGVEVKIVETGEIFNSIKACADYLGVSPSAVSRVVFGQQGRKTCRGYHIVITSDTPMPEKDISNDEIKRGRPGTRVKVVETGVEYDSISDCAKAINGSAGTIHDILHNKRSRSSHQGLHFEAID